jgi:hypothetical protein
VKNQKVEALPERDLVMAITPDGRNHNLRRGP